jgi:hypothetical protein
VLARPESIAFLRRRIGAADPAGLDAVADLLGDLPLALEEAAAYIERAQVGVQDYLKLLQDRSRELFALHGPATEEDADCRRVGTVWSLSLDRVRREEPAAEALLNLCAFLAPDLPRNFPTESPEVLPADLGAAVADSLAYNRILVAIGRYSLVTLTPTTASMHRLVQAVIQARLDPADERAWAEVAVARRHRGRPRRATRREHRARGTRRPRTKHRSRARVRFAPRPARPGSSSPTAAGYDRRSGKLGATPTRHDDCPQGDPRARQDTRF